MFLKILKQNLISKLVLVLVVLLPIFYLPLTFSSLVFSKIYLVYIFGLLIVAYFCYYAFFEKRINKKFTFIHGVIFLILISYLISAAFSINQSISFFGRDFTLDSLVTVLFLFVISLIISFTYPKKDVFALVFLTVVTSSFVSLIQIIHLFLPSLPSLGILYSSTSNLVGKLNDLSLFSVIGVLISLVSLEYLKLSKKFRYSLIIMTTINLLVIMFVNFYLSLYIMVFAVTFLALRNVVANRQITGFSIAGFCIAVLSLSFILFGSKINSFIIPTTNLGYVEVRPSISATSHVSKESLKNNLLFGSGPATFEVIWSRYRPSNVLQSEFWNLDFRYGHGIIMSFVVTLGVVGFLIWSLFILSLFFYGIKALFSSHLDIQNKFLLDSVAIVTMVIWLINFVYIPTTVLFSLGFIFTGVFLVLLVDSKLIQYRSLKLDNSLIKIMSIILLIVFIFIFWIQTLKFISHIYFQQSAVAATSGVGTSEIKSIVSKSIVSDKTDNNLRALASVNKSILLQTINNKEEIKLDEVNSVVLEIASNYSEALDYDPNNYINYLDFGDFYSDLVSLNISKQLSYDSASKLYTAASELKPNNPYIELKKTRLEFLNGNLDLARNMAINIVSAKPEYFEAYTSLSQIQIELGYNEEAINTIKEYIKLFPNDNNAKYQLALLYVQLGDNSSAINTFESLYKIDKNENIRKWIDDLKRVI